MPRQMMGGPGKRLKTEEAKKAGQRIGHPPVTSKPLPSLALPTRLPLALPFAAAFLLGQRAMSTIRRIIAHLVGGDHIPDGGLVGRAPDWNPCNRLPFCHPPALKLTDGGPCPARTAPTSHAFQG